MCSIGFEERLGLGDSTGRAHNTVRRRGLFGTFERH
jgi:hypothetical protein